MEIVAHRGLHHTFPENSLEAFKSAWNLPVRWCECDVYVLGDGVIVLHDETLDRTTQATGSVFDQAVCLLRDCRLRDQHGQLTEHFLPRLHQLIAQMPPEGRLLVELKGAAVGGYISDLFREIGDGKVMVQSFNPRDLTLTSRHDRTIPIAYLVETEEAFFDTLQLPDAAIHLKHEMLSEKKVRQLRRAGKSIGVWTVNHPADIQRMIDLKVDMLITDEPELATQIYRKHAGLEGTPMNRTRT